MIEPGKVKKNQFSTKTLSRRIIVSLIAGKPFSENRQFNFSIHDNRLFARINGLIEVDANAGLVCATGRSRDQ